MKKFFSCAVLASLILAGCSKAADGELSEKERFIAATSEISCPLYQAKNVLDPALEQLTKKTFKKYGFNVDDAEAFEKISKKYEKDEDLQKSVDAELKKCAK